MGMTDNAFGEWLQQQTQRNDPTGDVARDFIAKNKYGESCCIQFQNFCDILTHITTEHNPCKGALDALRGAYREYNKKMIGR